MQTTSLAPATAAADAASTAAPGGAGSFMAIVFIIFVLAMYFAPTIVALLRKHPQMGAIGALNLLLGWSVIGWIASFIWSLTAAQGPQTIIVQAPAQPAAPMPPQPAPTPANEPVASDLSPNGAKE